jgi:RND superfamily putative drug exporter
MSQAPAAGLHAASRTNSTGRLAKSVMRRKRTVMVAWGLIFLAGGYAASHLSSRLSFDFSLPGQSSYTTSLKVMETFGNGGQTSPSVVVVTVPPGQTVRGDAARLAAGFAAAQRANPRVRIVDESAAHVIGSGPGFSASNGRTTYAYVFAPPNESLGADHVTDTAVASIARALPSYTVAATGIAQLGSGGSSSGPGVLVETLVGGAGALAVLVFVFASVLAIVPLIVAAVAILSTFLVLLALTYITPVSFIVQFLVALVGLGIAIDYSLLVVTRWREERAAGLSNDEAVVRAMETAGRAVVISGLTVAIGLLSLVVLPVPFLRSTGIGGMLIPVISVAVVLTLLPALLSSVGPRWDWPRIRTEAQASRFWFRWATGVARRPWLAGGAAVLLLTIAIIPVFSIRVGQTSAAAEAQNGTAHALYDGLISEGVPAGVITPMEVLVASDVAASTARQLASVQGVSNVIVPSGPAGTRNGLTDLLVVPEVETVDSTTLGSVRGVEQAIANQRGAIGVTGVGAGQQAFASAVYGNAPLMILILATLMFVLLARAFRSIVLALQAVLLNIISLAATFGILTWFWQDGHGSQFVFGIPATGAVTFWVPITVFAFLFGLSMDYEVFILSRIREERDAGRSTSEAVVHGLARTGRLVTSAALILFLAFASLASAPITDLKVMATGLGIGILLDATIVRALLVPSLVVLFGRLNWWFPRTLNRLLGLPATST